MTTRASGRRPAAGRVAAAAALALALFAAPAAAELRCDRRLVGSGDRKIEVLKKCGHPVLVETRVEHGSLHRVHHGLALGGPFGVGREIEEWTYNFGPHRFMRLVRFADGKVVRILSLDNGY